MSLRPLLGWAAGLVLFLAGPGAQALPVAAPLPATALVVDARASLKAGGLDAGVAVSNMALVAALPKPEGFFEPQTPLGLPLTARGKIPRDAGITAFGYTDLAFSKDRLVVGSFHGFVLYDIADRDHPRRLSSVVCPGGQGDVSIHGDLVFFSAEQARGRIDCTLGSTDEQTPAQGRFEGLRIFDIGVASQPRQVAAIQTCRGSHTNTLVPDPADPARLYVYSLGQNDPRPSQELAGCSAAKPGEDPHTSLYSIDIIKVALNAPGQAAIVSQPRLFADAATGVIDSLWAGGDHGPGTQTSQATDGCHDVTVYARLGLAAAACMGDGLLLDIRDPAHPRRLATLSDPNFAFWHSAIFSNDGRKVVFADEWGGGIAPHCLITDPPRWGGDLIVDLVGGKMVPRSYYKLPGAQSKTDNCVAHNGGLIPVPGRDLAVQAWYNGGVSVMDFTDPDRPVEIAFFDRGPVATDRIVPAGHWAAYWYKGRIYASESARGLDVLKLLPGGQLTANEIAAAMLWAPDEVNPQSQETIVWPHRPVVGGAYLDQLARDRALDLSEIRRARAALAKLEAWRAGPPPRFPALVARLTRQADRAQGHTADRLRGLLAVLTQPALPGAGDPLGGPA